MLRWASPWLTPIRNQNYNTHRTWPGGKTLREELAYYELGNEQLRGNMAMMNADGSGFRSVDPVQQMVDVTRQAGAQYVGAIGYHACPHGQGYSSVSFILTMSGAGAPDPGRL